MQPQFLFAVENNASDRSKFGLECKKSDLHTLTLEVNAHFTLESTKNFVFTLDFAFQTLNFHNSVRFSKNHSKTCRDVLKCLNMTSFENL